MPPLETIKDWTPTILTKYIRDLFQSQPPDFLPNLKSEKMTASQTLVIADNMEYLKEPRFRAINGTGQPPFTSSWANYGAGWQVAGFWKDPLGWVHLRGMIASGTVGNPAFTLPPGHRPLVTELFGVMSNGAAGRVDVQSDGLVVPQSPSNNTWVSLSGIRFRTS